MHCPRCRVALIGNRCLQCGFEITPLGKNHSDKSRQSQEPKPIRFTIALHEKQEESSPTIDWRSELKRKLNHHIQKKESSKPELEQRSNPGTSRLGLEPRPLGQHGRTEEVRETQIKQSLFQYRLPERSSRDPKKNATFHQKVPTPSVPERPVIRRPAKVRPILQPSQQGTLALEEPRPSPITNSPDASSVKTIEQAELSGEILFSRLLGWNYRSSSSSGGGSFLCSFRLVDFEL